MEHHQVGLKIAFVANFELTPTFLAIANELSNSWGYEIHWFVFSRRWYRWLRRHKVPSSRLVKLFQASSSDDRTMPSFALSNDEPPLEELLKSDRVLGGINQTVAKRKVIGVLTVYRQELVGRGIQILFGEQTWAIEVLMNYVARDLGIPYLSPLSTRIPSNRLAFSDSPIQSNLVEIDKSFIQEIPQKPEEIVDKFLNNQSKLWTYNKFKVSKYLGMPTLMFMKILDSLFDSRSNPTQKNLLSYIKTKNPIKLVVNTIRLEKMMSRLALTSPNQVQDPYVLVTLHVQPEASIDILGWKHRDQLEALIKLRTNLDSRFLLAIKEHSHVFGSRSISFFENLANIPGVFFVHPEADTRAWLEHSSCVMSPTGTASLEKGLLGGPSFVFAPIWFSKLKTISVIDPSNYEQVNQFVQQKNNIVDDLYRLEFLNWVLSQSVEAQFGTKKVFPNIDEPGNLVKLSSAFHAASLAVIRN